MSCESRIPVDDIIDEIIEKVLEKIDIKDIDLSKFITRDEIDLTKYVTIEDGVAKNLTLREGLVADSQVVADLCAMLADCIRAKIQEELGCMREKDNHVVSFAIDRVNDLLTITMKHGEVYSVSKADLVNWLNINNEDKYITTGLLKNNNTLSLTRNDGNVIDVDLSDLQTNHDLINVYIVGNTMHLKKRDKSEITVNLPAPVSGGGGSAFDNYVSKGEVSGQSIILTMRDGTQVTIDLSTLLSGLTPPAVEDTRVRKAELVDTTLHLTYGSDSNDNQGEVTADLSALIPVTADNLTITGDGTQSNPLKATKGLKTASISGNILTLTRYDDTTATVDLSGLSTGTGTVNFVLSATKPTTSNETSLPTKMVGGREEILGAPSKYIEQVINGQTYLIPAYLKP